MNITKFVSFCLYLYGKIVKIAYILPILFIFSGNFAEAGHSILAVRSMKVKPYDEVLEGLKDMCHDQVKEMVLSDFEDLAVTGGIQKMKPGIVVAIGNGALFHVKAIRDIPIIYLMVLNPRSMLGGEENITGITIQIPPERQLGLFREALPEMKKIGLLFDPSRTRLFVERARSLARKFGLKLITREVHDTREVSSQVNSLIGEIDAFWMLPDPTLICSETVEFILLFSIENRIPVFTFSDKYVEMGAIMSISVDAFDLGRQAGEIAQKILAGAAIRDIPEVEPRKIEISVNVKAAKKLGLCLSDKIIDEAKVIK